MGKNINPYYGKWRIIEMELWDQDFVDLETEGHFTFDDDEMGFFQFGAVQGQMDYRIEEFGESEKLVFSWAGIDDTDTVSGRGWVRIKGNELNGKIYFHLGDSSKFKAKGVNNLD